MIQRRAQDLLRVAAFGVLLLVAAALVPDERVILFNVFATYIGLIVTLDLLVGGLGLLAAGHAAFFGAGGYGAALLWQAGVPLPLAGVAAVAGVALFALLVGLPTTSRTSGMYFAIVTFATGELLVQLVSQATSVTGGSNGLAIRWGVGTDLPFGLSIYRYFSFWTVALLMVVLTVAVSLRRSHFGLRMQAVKVDEAGTRGLGFAPTFYKATSFVASSALAALLGVVYVPMIGVVSPDIMAATESIYFIGVLMVGGINRISGAVLGALLLVVAPRLFDVPPLARLLVVGGAMAAIILTEPEGLAGLAIRARRRLRRFRGGGRSAAESEATRGASTTDSSAATPHTPTGRVAEPLDKREAKAEAVPGAEPLLTVESLGCTINGVRALDDVNMHVDHRELVGIVGPNGAGKSTLFNVVTGFLRPTSGTVLWLGRSVADRSSQDLANDGLARTFQNVGGFSGLTVGENLELASRGADTDSVHQVIEDLRLASHLDTRVDDCSLATRKLVGIGIAVVRRPRLLLLDEPLAGLDHRDRDAVTEMIRMLHAVGQTTVIIEHDLGRTMAMSQRVVILDAGRTVAAGAPAELRQRAELHDVYLRG